MAKVMGKGKGWPQFAVVGLHIKAKGSATGLASATSHRSAGRHPDLNSPPLFFIRLQV